MANPFKEQARGTHRSKVSDIGGKSMRDSYTKAESLSKDAGTLDTTKECSPREKALLTDSEQRRFLGTSASKKFPE